MVTAGILQGLGVSCILVLNDNNYDLVIKSHVR